MRPSFFIRLVLLNTFKKRLRALLVIGGIAITSATMIVLFGVSTGLREMVTTEVARSETKDVVTVDQRNIQQIRLNDEKLSKIRSTAGVESVEESVGLLGDVTYHNINVSIPLYGVTQQYFASSPNRFPSGAGEGLTNKDIVVSTKVLQAFGIDSDHAIGRTLTTRVTISKEYASRQTEQTSTTAPDEYTIVGVIDKGELPVAYIPMEVLRVNGLDSVAQLKVRLQSPDRMNNVRESIEQMGFQTSSIQDTVKQINKVFTVIQKTLVVFAAVVFLITVSGTFTIISLTLMEEMRQIGFLRISGLRNRDVMLIFVLQSIILTSLGAAVGIIGGIIGGYCINGLARSAATGEAFSGVVTAFRIPVTQIFMVLGLSVVIGWVVGLFPAKRAVLINPLTELRQ